MVNGTNIFHTNVSNFNQENSQSSIVTTPTVDARKQYSLRTQSRNCDFAPLINTQTERTHQTNHTNLTKGSNGTNLRSSATSNRQPELSLQTLRKMECQAVLTIQRWFRKLS